eukprot:g3693.t1
MDDGQVVVEEEEEEEEEDGDGSGALDRASLKRMAMESVHSNANESSNANADANASTSTTNEDLEELGEDFDATLKGGFFRALITIADYYANPASINVPRGTVVEFAVSEGERPTFETNLRFSLDGLGVISESPTLRAGNRWSFFAKDAGRISFRDDEDDEICGVITVSDSAQTSQFYDNADRFMKRIRDAEEADRKRRECRETENLQRELAELELRKEQEEEELHNAQSSSSAVAQEQELDMARQQAISDSLEMYRAMRENK